MVKCIKFEVQKSVGFMDYIFGGCQIALTIAIDYTASNGDQNHANSLHCKSANNQYLPALRAVTDILQYYDSDKLIPTYGFGAKLPGGPVMHKFAINGDGYRPELPGLQGVEGAYWNSLQSLKFYGPTNFAPIINEVVERAKALEVSQINQQYNVLLIMTDGSITDEAETVEAIVRGSGLPLSIIIVGIGNADFSGMERLDGDTTPLRDRSGRQCERDIVQFVPYNEHKSDPMKLAKATLAELPKQLTDFFQTKKIIPNPKESEKQLAMMQGFKSFDKMLDDYTEDRKLKMQTQLQQYKHDPVKVINMLNHVGCP